MASFNSLIPQNLFGGNLVVTTMAVVGLITKHSTVPLFAGAILLTFAKNEAIQGLTLMICFNSFDKSVYRKACFDLSN